MKATTIDEVINALDKIIEETKESASPAGYFAALYRKVTKSVKDGIADGTFQNGSRMEKLDVIFANRYLEAYDQYSNGQKPTESWAIAFDNAQKYWPIVLQHLLWGINAHINLDLGIAAAQTAPGSAIGSLKGDFDKINTILANLVEEVEEELSTIWPTLKTILTFSGKIDDFLINFSMEVAREGAWKFATNLAKAAPAQQEQMIAERDQKVAKIAVYINPPRLIPKLVFGLIRIGERGSIAEKITVLE